MSSTSNRGFASMDREKQREIASKGGRAAHMKGTAHEFTADEARQAGRKGGVTVSQNREHMAAIGRKGGQESGSRHRGTKSNPDQFSTTVVTPGASQSDQDLQQVDIDQSVGQQHLL